MEQYKRISGLFSDSNPPTPVPKKINTKIQYIHTPDYKSTKRLTRAASFFFPLLARNFTFDSEILNFFVALNIKTAFERKISAFCVTDVCISLKNLSELTQILPDLLFTQRTGLNMFINVRKYL